LFGGTGEAAVADNGAKVTQLIEFHKCFLSVDKQINSIDIPYM
jgi:hypothetical protein